MCNIGSNLFQDVLKKDNKKQQENFSGGLKHKPDPLHPTPQTPQNGIGGKK